MWFFYTSRTTGDISKRDAVPEVAGKWRVRESRRTHREKKQNDFFR